MTVKTAGVTVSAASQPAAQTIVAGGSFTFANITLDGTASGEDIRFSTLPLAYNSYGGSTHLTNCVLKDGSTSLNTGTNEVNPTATASSSTFTFDNGLNVLKGSVKSLTLTCNVPGNITSGGFAWGVDSGATITATGLTSSQSATVAINDSNGQKMTVTSAGTFTVTEDTAASLAYRQAYPSSSEVVLSRLKFHANNEAINITQLALQLTNVASSSPSDFVGNAVKLYKSDGTTLVGTLTFPNNVASTATNVRASTTISGFQIPKDGDAIMVVKAQLTPIGTSQAGVQGHLISVDYDGTNSSSTKGVGVSSGTNMNSSSGSDTAVAGVRVFRTVPTVSHVSNSNPLAAGSNLYQFKVKANPSDGNGVYLHKFTFQLATSSGVNVQQWQVFGPNGAVNATAVDTPAIASGVYNLEITVDTTAADRFVGPGEEKTYTLRTGLITTTGSAGTKDSVTIKLLGDSAYPGLSSLDATNSACANTTNSDQNGCTAFMNDTTAIDAGTEDDFIWSPQATSTVVTSSNDFTNGYGVPTGVGSDTLTNDLTAQTFERTI
jgi:hypothetical protein